MRLLFVIPHYFRAADSDQPTSSLQGRHGSTSGSAEPKIRALRRTVFALHQTFGQSQAMIRHVDRRTVPANESMRSEIHIVLVTTGPFHLADQARLPKDLVYQFSVDDDPTKLGFYAHRVLRDRWGNYDYYCYLEDDLALEDPWFFEKLRWFNAHVGDDKVLLPNRFERSEEHAYKKCYLDGDLAQRATAPFQDVTQAQELQSTIMGRPVRFVRPLNPHSGCFFLNPRQMQRWIEQPYFESFDTIFIGPLVSAATLGIKTTFQIYKPASENASFLEIEHSDRRYIHLIRMSSPEAPSKNTEPEVEEY